MQSKQLSDIADANQLSAKLEIEPESWLTHDHTNQISTGAGEDLAETQRTSNRGKARWW